jgi:hypothetical protein
LTLNPGLSYHDSTLGFIFGGYMEEKDLNLGNLGEIKIIDIIDNDDGSSKIIFDLSQEFIENYKILFNLEKFDEKQFEIFITDSIEKECDRLEAMVQQDPDFLWQQPKDKNE